METFSVTNWSEMQHYKLRSPPWIRVYSQLLDDYNFSCLQDASKLHLILIYLLASRNNNVLPYDKIWLKKRLGVESEIDLNELLGAEFISINPSENNVLKNGASNTLASCTQSAITSITSHHIKKEKKQKKKKPAFEATASVVFAYWKKTMGTDDEGVKETEGRKKKIIARLNQGYSLEQIKTAIDGCYKSTWHMGDNEEGKRHNCLTLICRDAEHIDQFIRYAKAVRENNGKAVANFFDMLNNA